MTQSTAQTVVITGASAGVGRATAREFARHGWRVALLARGRDGLEAAAQEVRDLGGEALVIPTDVADCEAVERAAQRTEERFGVIDVWVNNAMATVFGPFMKIKPDEFKRVIDVTFLGYVWGTMAALKRMVPRNRGTIVQVGSALAYRGIPLQSPYCAGKHAIQGFTESLRSELIHDSIDVHLTMVQLPGLNTPQFEWVRNYMGRQSKPLGTIFQPEVAARAIHFAAHARRREHYVGWQTMKTILGNRVAPGYLDRYLAEVVYQGHMTDKPDDPHRPDNLMDALPGDWGAHGPYDAEAVNHSPQQWVSRHRGWVAAGLTLAAGAVLGAIAINKARPQRAKPKTTAPLNFSGWDELSRMTELARMR